MNPQNRFVLPSDPEQLTQVILRAKDDFLFFIHINLWIKGDDGRLQPFVLRPNQVSLATDLNEAWKAGKPIRALLLKARKDGFTTLVQAFFYWILIFNKNYQAVIIAQDHKTNREIYNIFKTFHRYSLPPFKPPTITENAGVITFGQKSKDEDNNEVITGLNSEVVVLTAGNAETGRGFTPQLVHASEVPSWKNGESIMAGLLNAVPEIPRTVIIMESTAKRFGDYWHETWLSSEKENAMFKGYFFNWLNHPRYRTQPGLTLEQLTAEEIKLVKNFSIDGEQLHWRRRKVNSMNDNMDKFRAEYPLTPDEAFSYSGGNVFSPKALKSMLKDAYAAVFKYTKLEQLTADRMVGGNDIEATVSKTPTALKVWDKPDLTHEYVIGADVAGGRARGDYSVATVIRKLDMKVVARWRSRLTPEDFGDALVKLGLYYNTAEVGVELNNHGYSTILQLKNRNYPRIYRKNQEETTNVHDMGVRTWDSASRVGSKTVMTNKLADVIRKRKLIDHDIDAIKEYQKYMEDENGKRDAASGSHDDIVMSTAIGISIFDTTPMKQMQKYGDVYEGTGNEDDDDEDFYED